MKDFRKNTISIAINNILVNFFALISSILIARALQPERQGLVILVMLIANLLGQFVSPATQTATSYLINKEKAGRTAVASVVLWLSVVLPILFSMIVLVLSYFGFNFGLANEYISVKSAIIFSLIFLFLILPRVNLLGILYAIEKYKLSNKINLTAELLVFILASIQYFVGKLTLQGVLYSYVIAYSLSIILTLILLRSENIVFNWPDAKLLKKFIKYSLPIYYTSLMQSLQQRGNIIVLGLFLSLRDVGIFGIGYNIADKLNEIVKPIAVTHLPRAAQMSAGGGDEKAAKDVSEILAKIMAIFIIILPFFWFTIYLLLPIFYGSQYRASIPIVMIISIGVICVSMSRILNNLLAVYHLQRLNSIAITITTVLNLSLSLIVLKLGLGVLAVAGALSLSYLINFLIQLHFIYKYLKVRLSLRPDFGWAYQIIFSFIKWRKAV